VDHYSDWSTVDSRWEWAVCSPEFGLATGSGGGFSPWLTWKTEEVRGGRGIPPEAVDDAGMMRSAG
jgi:hypothetical protein